MEYLEHIDAIMDEAYRWLDACGEDSVAREREAAEKRLRQRIEVEIAIAVESALEG